METALQERIGELKKYYGSEAPVYDEDRFGGTVGRLYNQAHFAALLRFLRLSWGIPANEGPRRILEIAAGTGRTSIQLSAEGFSVFGLDITPEMLQLAIQKRAEKKGIHFIRGDAFCLPFPMGAFDAVFCSRMLQMIPREYYGDLGGEVERVLKPGGLLIVELWNDRYHKIRHLGGAKKNSQGMSDTFVHPRERGGLFGPKLMVEGLRGLGFPLLLRVASKVATRPCMDIYMRLSESSLSRSLGETMLVQYRKTR